RPRQSERRQPVLERQRPALAPQIAPLRLAEGDRERLDPRAVPRCEDRPGPSRKQGRHEPGRVLRGVEQGDRGGGGEGRAGVGGGKEWGRAAWGWSGSYRPSQVRSAVYKGYGPGWKYCAPTSTVNGTPSSSRGTVRTLPPMSSRDSRRTTSRRPSRSQASATP